MNPASISDIKKQLKEKSQGELIDVVLRLAKYKKENKELLSYLLFDADDEAQFVADMRDEMSESFAVINTSSVFLAKKTIRKVARNAAKVVKFSSIKSTEVELYLHFCRLLQSCPEYIQEHFAIQGIYARHRMKIEKAIDQLHEDVQFDYKQDLQNLTLFLR
jgi:hypothetical protein